MGGATAHSTKDIPCEHLRLRVKIGQANCVNTVKFKLAQRTLSNCDRRQDLGAKAALLKHLPDHLRGRVIKLRPSCKAQDRLTLGVGIILVFCGSFFPDMVLNLPHDKDGSIRDEATIVRISGATLPVILCES